MHLTRWWHRSRLQARNSFWIASCSLLRYPRPALYGHDLLGRSVTALVRLDWNRVPLQLGPIPSAGNMRAAVGTIQSLFIGESFRQRLQERSVTIRAAAKQISDMAFRTLDPVTNTGRHGTIKCKGRYCLLTVPQSLTVAEFADENEVVRLPHPCSVFKYSQSQSLRPALLRISKYAFCG
jgi:hypothetical protein